MTILQAVDPRSCFEGNQKATNNQEVEYCVVTQAALNRFRSSPYFALRSLTCLFRSGQLRLVGTVQTYYMKQMAQETIRTVDGVEEIDNQVTVRD